MYAYHVNLNTVINVIHIFSLYDVTGIVRQVHVLLCIIIIIIIIIIINWNVLICRKVYFNDLLITIILSYDAPL